MTTADIWVLALTQSDLTLISETLWPSSICGLRYVFAASSITIDRHQVSLIDVHCPGSDNCIYVLQLPMNQLCNATWYTNDAIHDTLCQQHLPLLVTDTTGLLIDPWLRMSHKEWYKDSDWPYINHVEIKNRSSFPDLDLSSTFSDINEEEGFMRGIFINLMFNICYCIITRRNVVTLHTAFTSTAEKWLL